jgi:hypothetical protein
MRDIFTGFFTIPASPGTFTTMVHIVSFTLISTSSAQIGTNPDHLIGNVRTPDYQFGSGTTNGGTIPVQPDAIDHHGQLVAFVQTCVCAIFTFDCTLHQAPDQIILLHFHNFEI